LKLAFDGQKKPPENVALFASAWIETILPAALRSTFFVALFASAWIETKKHLHNV